jgi:hypothetical protein
MEEIFVVFLEALLLLFVASGHFGDLVFGILAESFNCLVLLLELAIDILVGVLIVKLHIFLHALDLGQSLVLPL